MRRGFVQDIQVEGELHVVTVRSQRASAALAGVSLPELPAGVTAVLARDIPGRPTLIWGAGSHPILASDTVRYVGEPVALIAASELEVAQRVAAEVVLRYVDPVGGGWVPEADTLRVEGGAGPSADDPEVAERQIVTASRRFAPPSPQEVVAQWEGDTLLIRTATRDPFHVRDTVAAVLGLPQGAVRVMAEPLDGPDGKHLMPSLVAAHGALVCAATRQPARVRYSWREELGASFRIAGSVARWRAAVDGGARLHLALEGGAYDPMAGEVMRRVLRAVPGPYRAASLGLSAEYRFSETVPCELGPGCGELEATLARELWVSEDAVRRGLDPATHRLELLGGSDVAAGEERRKARARGWGEREVIREVVRRSGFHRRYAACAAAAERRGQDTSIPLRGIGIALATFGAGFGAEAERGVRIRLTMGRDRRVVVHSSCVDTGRGSRELFQRIVCRALDLEPSSVSVPAPDTLVVPDTGPAAASRTVTILVPLLRRCARLLRSKSARGGLPVTVEASHRPDPRPGPAACAATVVSVEIEGETGILRCAGAWCVVDAGEILDPEGARSAAAAAVVRGLGIATTEQSEAALVPVPPASDPYAAPAPAYRVAGIEDLCPLDVAVLESGEAKTARPPQGISEVVLLSVPAAVAAAAEQALGQPVTRLPIEVAR